MTASVTEGPRLLADLHRCPGIDQHRHSHPEPGDLTLEQLASSD